MKTLTIIDAYGFLFRAYYMLPELKTLDGIPTGGLCGFTNILLKEIKKLAKSKNSYVVVTFDTGSKNFRHDIYKKYKANRTEPPEDLKKQFPLIREAVKAFGISAIEVIGLEADDLIATITHAFQDREDLEIIIITSDKDLLQLRSERVKIFDPAKEIYLDNEHSLKKFGVDSNKISDLLALAGDASDNIPGISGVGVKTAAKLINQFGSVEGILQNIELVSPPRIKKNIETQFDELKIFKKLVELRIDKTIEVSLDSYKFKEPDLTALENFLIKYEFKSIQKKIHTIFKKPKKPETSTLTIHNDTTATLTEFIEKTKYSGKLAIIENEQQFLMACDEQNQICISKQEIDQLSTLLKNNGIKKITLGKTSIDHMLPYVEDLSIISYSIKTQKHEYTIEMLCKVFLGDIPENVNAYTLIRLYTEMYKKLSDEKNLSLYEFIDRPIKKVLETIEKSKIQIDVNALICLEDIYTKQISKLETEIHDFAGYTLNIGSPEQVSSLLSAYIDSSEKKTKSGFFSTNVDLLERLTANGLTIAGKILEWRHISKLKNTYTTPLIKAAVDGYIHTNYSIFTATGRFSSSNYNIHNLPIKTKEGQNIRKAFVAKKNHVLISADYSQIELRVMSHIANVSGFINAFMNNRDIHNDTAVALFDMPANLTEISNLRRKAKIINFGIMYGISAFGLSKQLKNSIQDAKKYIENYFTLYPEISEYIKETTEQCMQNNCVKTIFGRKCAIDGINSKNAVTRNHAQRQAINAPIQGSAADILKLALNKLHKNLPDNSNIMFQVHDEVIVETPEDNFKEVALLIKNTMEDITTLKIPLIVDVKVGYNWLESFWTA